MHQQAAELAFDLDVKEAIVAQRQVVLADLIALRQIGVEIILAVEAAPAVDLGVEPCSEEQQRDGVVRVDLHDVDEAVAEDVREMEPIIDKPGRYLAHKPRLGRAAEDELSAFGERGGEIAAAQEDRRLGHRQPDPQPDHDQHVRVQERDALTPLEERVAGQDEQQQGQLRRGVARDDQADPRTAVQVAQQIVDEEVQGILGHFNSGTTIPASRVYNDARLPQIAMATSPEYTQQNYDTTFRMMTSDTQQGAAAGGRLRHHGGFRSDGGVLPVH